MKLRELTEQLLQECETCKNRFYQMREKDETPDFFHDVKPYADSIQMRLIEWKENATLWIKEHKPKYLHEQQIESTVESMNQFVVQSFYKETSKKRFLQSIHSVQYTLTTFLRYIKAME